MRGAATVRGNPSLGAAGPLAGESLVASQRTRPGSRRPAGFRPDSTTADRTERLGALAHQLRNLLNTTIVAVSAIKAGRVGFSGATATALDRSLLGMREVIDQVPPRSR